MASASPVSITPAVHLKRAYGFIKEVEKETEEFRDRAIRYDAQVNSNEPFLQGMLNTFRGSKALKEKKSALLNDLQIASDEIDRAMAADPNAALETSEGPFTSVSLKAIVACMRGQLEMILGSNETAKQLLRDALNIAEFPDAHYMLALIYESEYEPAEALRHFEKCLELDPGGELSVPALREAKAMRTYKKKFRGSWGLLLILLVFPIPFVGAIIYFAVKHK